MARTTGQAQRIAGVMAVMLVCVSMAMTVNARLAPGPYHADAIAPGTDWAPDVSPAPSPAIESVIPASPPASFEFSFGSDISPAPHLSGIDSATPASAPAPSHYGNDAVTPVSAPPPIKGY